MNKIKIANSNTKDIKFIKYNLFTDIRGSFFRLFCTKELKNISFSIKQINIASNRKKYTFRGFHYQKKNPEKKIIKIIKGKAIFIALNINKKSKNFFRTSYYNISEKDKHALYIPDHYATAYLTLEKDTKLLYLMNNFYKPNDAHGFNYKDPKIEMKYKKLVKVVSEKDKIWKFYE